MASTFDSSDSQSFTPEQRLAEVTSILARLGHMSRARVTQIMNLLLLAPRIQEEILSLAPVEDGHNSIKEWQVRPIAAEPNWAVQVQAWNRLLATVSG